MHLLQKEQFPGIGSNQPGADPQILDIAFLGEIFRILWGGKFDNFGRKDVRRKNDNWFNLDDPIIL